MGLLKRAVCTTVTALILHSCTPSSTSYDDLQLINQTLKPSLNKSSVPRDEIDTILHYVKIGQLDKALEEYIAYYEVHQKHHFGFIEQLSLSFLN